ncbi:CrcB family protein [Paenibacillus sp. LHD-117]|uniref:fluoride efflux transporter FluC n=1 Tax=Paenibacillus sp. LHD-117 TaxID=3071412 RepID=UPI0027DEB4D6|nr:CrcB family protein [Paenibacillus sp. LHD-117]MDQ6421639.1 CrcB family protein [Paenibacillus sp. LHD-117]
MKLIALVVGGFIGTILRYELGNVIPPLSSGFPLGIMIINLLGSFFLGWFFTVTLVRWNVPPRNTTWNRNWSDRGFTTFSTFSVQSVDLIQSGHFFIAALYILLSIIGGLLLIIAGIRLAKVKRRQGTA